MYHPQFASIASNMNWPEPFHRDLSALLVAAKKEKKDVSRREEMPQCVQAALPGQQSLAQR